jgi:dCTP deaminase
MSLIPDSRIQELVASHDMISPFVGYQVRSTPSPLYSVQPEPVISYGLSSFGYDVRCADEFKIFTNINSSIVDPKDFDPKGFISVKADSILIPPNSFVLTHTVEYFKIPRNVLVLCVGKSTYARCGLLLNVTPLEPEWEGQVTLEISNTTSLPARVYANEGIAQFLFFESSTPCSSSYADKKGKYQGQKGTTLPIT